MKKEILPLTLHSLKEGDQCGLREGSQGVVKPLSKKIKPPFAEERNINTENFSW